LSRITPLLRGVAEGVRDLLWPWPTTCYVCGRPISPTDRHGILCPDCATELTLARDRCIRCGRLLSVGQPAPGGSSVCRECRLQPPPFERLFTLGSYEGPVGALVRGLKYRRDTYLIHYLGPRLCSLLAQHEPVAQVVVPMPIHPQRLRRRGFNQAALLARYVARRRCQPYAPRALARTRATRPLADMDPGDRLTEVRDAFKVLRPSRIRGQAVLLVDDILTTGASANECARVLLGMGASRVEVLVVARAELHLRTSLERQSEQSGHVDT